MNTDVMFSSKKCEWETPQHLFDYLNEKYGPFNIDVCALKENAKCNDFFSPEDDGLKQTWSGKCWMNPPYGRTISLWLDKAHNSVAQGHASIVVCLIPSRTDTKWFHKHSKHSKIMLLKGRLKFGGHNNSAPFPSAIMIFGLKPEITTEHKTGL